ncbi:globin domain-containing protein [Staphylococcus cohnii]|uniref:globin domain-containing protein n=1 Tax=Staphylococcus cohnii TaxID=29382 RepID=UPI0005895AA3|nr:globin domain-containing protein [Staphylococcus cohnii]OIS30866.1 nitric oxide dioxygenase [Staphylococcus cohnii]OIS32562.1 nitric oxide dioxygenase [Staphylococcus cohnii]OIS34115.1 nitric oxide dioxygenase [Staphylococcus cohnii]
MLTNEEIKIIKETVPLLKDEGQNITSIFYNRLFEEHPELKNVFNQTNQKKGLQSSALAMAVLAAADNIDDLSPIVPVIMPVVYKHCALQVQPEHYPIVGENLIWAIQEVTGLTDDSEIIQTWIKAYQAIADAFIGLEKEVYSQMAWEGFKPFEVTDINKETEIIKSFTIQSEDIDLSQFTPGQYITVNISNKKLPYQAKRHYSIVDGNRDYLTFGVRKDFTEEHEGEVSTILHDEVNIGDTLELSAPVGGFGLVNKDKKQLLLGSGVGVTPLVSMYREAVESNAAATFIQVTSDSDNIAFEDTLKSINAKSEESVFHVHLRDEDGYIEKKDLEAYLDDETEIYICGGSSFLNSMMLNLQALEIPEERIHFEAFVPRLSFSV